MTNDIKQITKKILSDYKETFEALSKEETNQPKPEESESWEEWIEERFTAYHFEVDENRGQDKATAQIRDDVKAFIANKLSKAKEEAREEERQRISKLFQEHYWDSLEIQKTIILKHIDSVLALLN